MSQADPSASTSILNADTPSWSEIDGILSDKYKSESDPAPALSPTQSTQDTLVQQPLGTQTQPSPIMAYYSQPQFREGSFDHTGSDYERRPLSSLPARICPVEMSTPPRASSSALSSRASFGSSQRERIARLRRELLEEEERVMARSDDLAQSMRKQAVSALNQNEEAKPSTSASVLHPSLGLDSSQQLTHSLLEEQSRTRLRIAKPPSLHSEPLAPVNSISVDLTPLTEDLLMNSRTDQPQSDGAQTISDSQFPNDDDIIFTPISDDDDFGTAFATPPRVARKLDKKVQKPTPKRSKVQLHSQGKVIGTTELGSFDETSSLSIIDKDNVLSRFRDTVKPLRRHAWSDSETENSLSKSLNRQQFDEIKTRQELPTHVEKISTNITLPSEVDRPRSAFAVLSPHEGKYRPYTAPSSEKLQKFDFPSASNRFLSKPEKIEQKISETSFDSADYPNLKSSFASLQNTIMSDIAALRREIVEKQEGTEKLRAEFSDFKHAYYKALVEKQGKAKRLQDAKIQTSQNAPEDNENRLPPAQAVIEHKDTSYSECDSETERQLATLKALQRSLREQSNERYLRDIEERLDAKAARTIGTSVPSISPVSKVDRMKQSSPAQLSSRSIQTAPPKPKVTVDANCNTSDMVPPRPRSRAEEVVVKSRTPEPARPTTSAGERSRSETLTRSPKRGHSSEAKLSTHPTESGDSSLDSAEQATRDIFMDILRKKAELDEEERKNKRVENHASTRNKYTSTRNIPSSTPNPAVRSGKSAFTPASIVSENSTLTDGTFVAEEDVEGLNALWSQFMKFVVQSKALKQHKSKSASRRAPCIQVDVRKLEKLQKSFSKETYRKDRSEKVAHRKKSRSPAKSRSPEKHKRKRDENKSPEMFELSAGELKEHRGTYTVQDVTQRSVDSRDERINRLIREIEGERRRRQEKRTAEPDLIPAELDSFPVRDHKEVQAPSTPPPPNRHIIKSPVAFEISLDVDSVTSEEVDRAPGYPYMVFKTDKLQDAFQARKQRFIRKSRRRALQIQLCKEARQKYASVTPPERPRPTIDTRYFADFDIPPPKNKVISRREMTKNSKKLYEQLEEVQTKKRESKVQRERETHRLRAKLFNKRVQDTVLGKKYINSVRLQY